MTLLGTGTPARPQPGRPSTLVRAGGQTFLFDCGRGVLRAAAARCGRQLEALLLTHLHSDHITDLNDGITRWVTSARPPLPIVGPGNARGRRRDPRMLGPDIGYRIAHHEDMTEPPPVRCTSRRRRRLDGDVHPRGAHRPQAGRAHVGTAIEHAGSSVVIAGDTVPCAGLDELCAGADASCRPCSARTSRGDPAPAPPRHVRLPLDGQAGRRDRRPGRRRHPRPHPPGAPGRARSRGRVAGAGGHGIRRQIDSATTCIGSRFIPACASSRRADLSRRAQPTVNADWAIGHRSQGPSTMMSAPFRR